MLLAMKSTTAPLNTMCIRDFTNGEEKDYFISLKNNIPSLKFGEFRITE